MMKPILYLRKCRKEIMEKSNQLGMEDVILMSLWVKSS